MYCDDKGVGYFQPPLGGLGGFGKKLKKLAKAPVRVAQKVVQKTPMPKQLRKIAQKPLSFATRQIDKGTLLERRRQTMLKPLRALRSKPQAIEVDTPAQTEEIIEVNPTVEPLTGETYPMNESYAQSFSFPGIPDNAAFYEADGSGDAAPIPSQPGTPEVAPAAKPKMSGAVMLRLGLAALALYQMVS